MVGVAGKLALFGDLSAWGLPTMYAFVGRAMLDMLQFNKDNLGNVVY